MEFNLDQTLKEMQEDREAFDKKAKAEVRANNKLAREMGYPRGVKQMIEEGAI